MSRELDSSQHRIKRTVPRDASSHQPRSYSKKALDDNVLLKPPEDISESHRSHSSSEISSQRFADSDLLFSPTQESAELWKRLYQQAANILLRGNGIEQPDETVGRSGMSRKRAKVAEERSSFTRGRSLSAPEYEVANDITLPVPQISQASNAKSIQGSLKAPTDRSKFLRFGPTRWHLAYNTEDRRDSEPYCVDNRDLIESPVHCSHSPSLSTVGQDTLFMLGVRVDSPYPCIYGVGYSDWATPT